MAEDEAVLVGVVLYGIPDGGPLRPLTLDQEFADDGGLLELGVLRMLLRELCDPDAGVWYGCGLSLLSAASRRRAAPGINSTKSSKS